MRKEAHALLSLTGWGRCGLNDGEEVKYCYSLLEAYLFALEIVKIPDGEAKFRKLIAQGDATSLGEFADAMRAFEQLSRPYPPKENELQTVADLKRICPKMVRVLGLG